MPCGFSASGNRSARGSIQAQPTAGDQSPLDGDWRSFNLYIPIVHTGSVNGASLVDLRMCFSNPGRPLKTLISRVLKGSIASRPRNHSGRIVDQRGPVCENSSQSQTRLSASSRAGLIADYVEGVPVHELAARFNIHRGTVREIARRAGHASRQPELSDRTRAEAAHLYKGGLTLAQVAEQLGISDEGVRAAVVACGGTIRPPGRRRVVA